MGLSKYTYEQLGLGSGLDRLTEAEKKTLEKSWAFAFASDIFPFLDEQIFIPVYSGDMRGRRNIPVNVLAGAMLLQELRQMSEKEIVEAAAFDLRVRTALHLTNRIGRPFSISTLRRFRNRLKRYFQGTGENLLRICYGKIGCRIAVFIAQYEKRSPWYAAAAAFGKRSRREDPAMAADAAPTAADALAKALAQSALYRTSFDPEIVRTPEFFKENCLPAHSDHIAFADEKELEAGREDFAGKAGSSSLRHSLNGLWKFSYAARPADAPEGFEEPSFDCRGWADIRVPAHIQMEGYDIPAYINYQYPWDGREDIVPGEIPEQFNPTASYVKYFTIPEHLQAYLAQGSPLCISFQGVESGFALWCNGRYVGYSEDSFTPSEFDLTPFLSEGENKLAVRVFKWTASSWLESQDFYRFSGIFRDVYLFALPTAHLYDLRITPALDETLSAGTLEVEAEVWVRNGLKNRKESPEDRLFLYYELTKEGLAKEGLAKEGLAKEGHTQHRAASCAEGAAGAPFVNRDPEKHGAGKSPDLLCAGRIPVGKQQEPAAEKTDPAVSKESMAADADGSGLFAGDGVEKVRLRFSQPVENPLLWSAEDPQLYDLTLRLVYEKQPAAPAKDAVMVEIIRERVGFRRFERKDGLMCLNGKRIVFRGVNRHEFTCDSGRVVPDEVTRQDLIVMKQNNINAVRTCHYPNSSALYRLCDELGLYMIAENNLETHASWAPAEAGLPTPGIVPGDDERWLPLLLDRVNSCFQRDKNHPSILIWSVGNESFGGTVIRDMADRFRALDPGRLVHYEGIFHDRSWPSSSDMESQMYPSAEAIEAFLQEHRDKPFICCEYTHAMANSCGGMHRYTDLALREPLYQGGFIWDFVDQSLRRRDRYGVEFQAYGGDCGERPTDYDFSGNGILDGTRRPYAGKMQEVKYNYQDVRIDVTVPEQESRETEGVIPLSGTPEPLPQVKIRNDSLFTNTSKYDCFIILEKNGQKIAEASLETAVPPLQEAVYPLPEAICARMHAEKIKEEGQRQKNAAVFPDEYCMTVSMRLRDDCAWAKRGHETAFGQWVSGTGAGTQPVAAGSAGTGAGTQPAAAGSAGSGRDTSGAVVPSAPAAQTFPVEIAGTQWKRTIPVSTPYGKMELTRGSFNTGIRGESFDALFSILQGGLVSFRHGTSPASGRNAAFGAVSSSGGNASAGIAELLEKIPKPCFWRAPTSNDAGCRMAARHGVWKLADAYQIPRPETLRILVDADSVFLQIKHELPVPGARTYAVPEPAPAAEAYYPAVTVGYRFYADGMLTLSLDWQPVSGADLPPMPVFGFSFRLSADYDRFTYYGKGPAENYCDRSRGARLGIYRSTVQDNMSPYLVPQECGNRTGVRWAQVTDIRGRGLRFTAGDPHRQTPAAEGQTAAQTRPVMEFSALPYSLEELENASHPNELPPVHYTNVRCAWMQMGVGGDDSWGARTLPQYCLPADRALHFEMTLQGI